MPYRKFKHVKSYLAGYYRAHKDPLVVQKELLQSIIKKNKLTQYGVEHNFSDISSLKDFQKLPIISYEDIAHYVDAIANGAKNILTADEVISFAVTSGSTSKAKLIPVTAARKSSFFRDVAYYGSLNPGLLKDKMLYIAGPRKERETPAGIPVGSISGYLVSIQPWFVKKRMVVPVEVYDILDIDQKLEAMALHSLEHRLVTHLSFSSCVEAILFFDYLRENKSRLVKQLIKRGYAFRARQLSKIEDFCPANIWPDMKNVSCVLSAGNRSYFPAFFKKFGRSDLTIRDPGVLASEGRLTLTVKVEDNIAYGIPTVVTYLYEFCRLQDDGSFADPVFIDKVRKGETYKIILTSQEGLYRYETDDLFRVEYFEKKLPVLRFLHRTKCLNMAGELAAHEHIIAAVRYAISTVGLPEDTSYLVLPWFKESNGKPRYEVLLDQTLDTSAAQKFASFFDTKLRDLVYPYERMRTFFGRILPPRVSCASPEGFIAVQKERIQNSGGQPKPVLVSPDESLREKFAIVASYNSVEKKE